MNIFGLHIIPYERKHICYCPHCKRPLYSCPIDDDDIYSESHSVFFDLLRVVTSAVYCKKCHVKFKIKQFRLFKGPFQNKHSAEVLFAVMYRVPWDLHLEGKDI